MVKIDDMAPWQEKRRKENEEFEKYLLELRRQDLAKEGLTLIEPNSNEQPKKKIDHPDTMENGPATLLYIAVMLGGSIFNDRILIWVVATVIFFRFITRHSR